VPGYGLWLDGGSGWRLREVPAGKRPPPRRSCRAAPAAPCLRWRIGTRRASTWARPGVLDGGSRWGRWHTCRSRGLAALVLARLLSVVDEEVLSRCARSSRDRRGVADLGYDALASLRVFPAGKW